jgi:hypothetical protein
MFVVDVDAARTPESAIAVPTDGEGGADDHQH